MTVPASLVRDVHAADAQLPDTMPLLTTSAAIAKTLNQPQSTVLAVLRGYYLTVQERAA